MKLNLLISLYILLSSIIIVSASSRILNYYYDNNRLFTIEENKDNYKVVSKNIILCFRAPCDPQIVGEKTITNKEDIENLKIVFDEIFNDSDAETKVKNLLYLDLTTRQNEIIKNVLERNKILYKLDYTIIDDLDEYNREYNKRGYYYEEENDEAIVTIAMGEEPSGGYSINVAKIEIDGSEATIYVNETSPPDDAIVSHALTYPIVQIKFTQIPSKVNVINAETDEKFPLIEESFSRISGSFLNVRHFLLLLAFFIF
jgi:hypothetical protein